MKPWNPLLLSAARSFAVENAEKSGKRIHEKME